MLKFKGKYHLYKDKLNHVLTRFKTYSNWYTLIWPLTRLLPKKRIVHLRGGGKILLRNILGSDFVVTHEMFYRDDYGLRRIATKNDAPIILDVGANIGAFTILAALSFPNAKIFAFEPEIENYQVLKENIGLNNIANRITAVNSALAEEAGDRVFYISHYEYAHSLVKEQMEDETKDEKRVHCTTLPQILQNYNLSFIDILKLDIEGSEYEVFFKLPDEIFNKIGIILLEIHRSDSHQKEDLIKFFENRGFDVIPSRTHPRVFMCLGNKKLVYLS